MFFWLWIFDSIISFWAYLIEKIGHIIGINYKFQSNNNILLRFLSNKHAFLDANLNKISYLINLSDLYFFINLYSKLFLFNRQ